jgi:signal transduction histidine kinase
MQTNHIDMAPIQNRSLIQRFCGRWLISWRLLAINIFLSIFLIAGGDLSRSDENTNIKLYVTFWLLGYLLVISFAAIMHLTIFKNRALHPAPLWMVISYQIILSTLFTVSYQFGCGISDLSTKMLPPAHMILIFSICINLQFTSSAIADIWDEVSSRHRELVEQRVQVQLLELSQKQLQEEFRTELNAELEMALKKLNEPLIKTLQKITSGLAKLEPAEVSSAIKDSAQESVRPLSKTLWQESSNTIKRPPLSKIVAIAISTYPIPTFWLTGLIVITQSINPFLQLGFWRGLTVFVFTGGLTIAICTTANAITKRKQKLYLPIFIAVFLLLQFRRYLSAQIVAQWASNQESAEVFVTQIVINAIGFVGISTLIAWRRVNVQALNELQLDIKEQQVAAIARSKQAAEVAREMSRVLHGAVQTRLVACAMTIDSSSKSGDEASLNLAMLEALSILQAPLPISESEVTLGAEVARKLALWHGLCLFELQIDPRLVDVTNPEPREVGRIIEEGISNSIRHGGASKIAVSVMSGADSSVVVQIDDNGSGISKPSQGKPGIGTAMFASATGGSWSLSSLEQGARLLAVIPAQKI